MNVVCFGQTNWDYCWTGKQHLMSRLARRGHRVLYVDPDWRVLRRVGVDSLRALAPLTSGLALRKLAPRLWIHTPTPSPLVPWRLEQHRQRHVLRRLMARLDLRDPMVISMSPRVRHMAFAIEAQARLHFVYDEMTGFEGTDEARRRAIQLAEAQCLRGSDLAVGVSEALVEKMRRIQPEVRLLLGGADTESLAAAADRSRPWHACLHGLSGPIVALVGQIDQRLDYALLEHLARSRPDWNLVLVGRERPGSGADALRPLPNVRFTGYLPYAELADVLRGVDVGLVPYRSTPLTRACNPLKVYEYLAAGCPVVATPLDGLAAFGGAVTVAEDAKAFVAAVARALERPGDGAALRRSVVQASSWEQRVDDLEVYLEQARHLARRRRLGMPGEASGARRSADRRPRFGEQRA